MSFVLFLFTGFSFFIFNLLGRNVYTSLSTTKEIPPAHKKREKERKEERKKERTGPKGFSNRGFVVAKLGKLPS